MAIEDASFNSVLRKLEISMKIDVFWHEHLIALLPVHSRNILPTKHRHPEDVRVGPFSLNFKKGFGAFSGGLVSCSVYWGLDWVLYPPLWEKSYEWFIIISLKCGQNLCFNNKMKCKCRVHESIKSGKHKQKYRYWPNLTRLKEGLKNQWYHGAGRHVS